MKIGHTVASHKYVARGTFTNPYVVLVNKATGDIFDNVTGVPSAAKTWAGNAIAGTQHDESDFWTFTLPALSTEYEYILCLGDNATPAETDVLNYCGYYSPETKCVIDDGLPNSFGRLLVAR